MNPQERETQLATLEKIPATAQLAAEYRSRIEQRAAGSTATADRLEVLNRLYQFFSRHYQDGDFIVERRYGRAGSRYIRSTGEDIDYEQRELGLLLESVFGENSIAGVVSIRINPSGRPKPSGFAVSHEYAFFVQTRLTVNWSGWTGPRPKRADTRKWTRTAPSCGSCFAKGGSGSEKKDRPTMHYPLFVNVSSVRVPTNGME